MTTPQQPELARSRRSAADPASAKSKTGAEGPPAAKGPAGPVPEDNQPGHHPEREQDKPAETPPALIAVPKPGRQRFMFAFEPRLVPFSFALGVTPWTSAVEVYDGKLRIRFGPWSLETTIDNVEDTELSGPYSWTKVAGPPRVSFVDRGVTFATNTKRGVCIRFREPVPAALPRGLIRHPGATVTVDDPEGLVYSIAAAARREEVRAAVS